MIINEKWRIKSSYRKIFNTVSIILSGIVLIFAALGLFGILDIKIVNYIIIPSVGVITLNNGIATYKENRKAGLFAICCAILTFTLSIFVLVINLVD
jgi:cytochrome bd-type quinol oxidase subunit 2